MSASNQTPDSASKPSGSAAPSRVTTIISGAGVHPMTGGAKAAGSHGANENHWFDRIGFRRRWYANIAGALVAVSLLVAGVWIVREFVRLQALAACYEAGRRNCSPLDFSRNVR